MVDIIGTLNKNIGKNAVIKFFRGLDGTWYMIGNGGMGTLMTMKVEEKDFEILENILENKEFVFISRNYLYEIGKEGHAYFYAPENKT